jgi:hypothetical protein
MPTQPQSNDVKPIPLEYATPSPKKILSTRREFAAACSVLVTIISLPCLYFGVGCFVWGVNEADAWARENIARGLGLVFVGIFCLWFAIRWGRFGFLGRERLPQRRVNRMKAFGIFLAAIGGLASLNNTIWRFTDTYNPYDRHDFNTIIGGFVVSFLLFAIGLLLVLRSKKYQPGGK